MNTPKTRNDNIVVQEIDKELLIYDLKENKAFCLNETSALIWQLCDGSNSMAEISKFAGKKLNQNISEDLIWLALDEFKKCSLLEESEKFEIDFNGLNRRQIIKKVGLASMIALPIVSSIVAPTAAHALSGNCTVNFNGFQGTCPLATDRCVDNFCVPCTPSGSPVSGGACSAVNLPGIRQCCTSTCNPITNTCT
jgi:hypothetical protein